MATATFTILNQLGDPVEDAKVYVLDSANVMLDSGITDSNGIIVLGPPVGDHRVIVQKNGTACGNSIAIEVT
jgi:uncharacterized protein YfaS (alpha-2-macroglobulin family)